MLDVSVHPQPLMCTVILVPTGPLVTSSGSAVGLIQCVPSFLLPPPKSIIRPCVPPRSSGVLTANSMRPDASALASPIGAASTPKPRPETRLPTACDQLSL